MNNIIKRLVLGYVGFTTYIAIEVCFRGYSYPLMGLCGATLLIVLDMLIELIPWSVDLFWQGMIGSCIITGMELVIGLTVSTKMWDYSNMWMNFRGVICPLFFCIWVAVSMIGIMLADSINYYLLYNGSRPLYKLFSTFTITFPKRKGELVYEEK